MPNIAEQEKGNFTELLPLQQIIFTGLPISCAGGMAVLAVMLKHTMADIQVTSLPPLWQSFTKMLILLGSNLTVVYIRTTLRDLWGYEGVTDDQLNEWLTFIFLTAVFFTGWNTNQRRIAAPREPTARSTEPSLFMSIVPWILRPKYCRPGAKSAAAILWETDRRRDLSERGS